MPDAHANFAYGMVAVAPYPDTTGNQLSVRPGEGPNFPTPPFNAVCWPDLAIPLVSNSEIVRVTGRSGDTFTIVREQEGTTAKVLAVGFQFAAAITAKVLTDIEVALTPPGAIIPYGGFVAPAGGAWLMADGAPVSRAAYAALFNNTTMQQNGTLTNASATVTGLSDTSQLYIGCPVEGVGVPPNTTVASILSGTSVTLSAAATAGGTTPLRFLPWGRGDGSATFNKPDPRGRQLMGRGTHPDNSGLGQTEGLALAARTQKHGHTHTLVLPNHGHAHALTLPDHAHAHTLTLPAHAHAHALTLPNHAHAHSLTLPAHAHSISDPGHAHSVYDPGHGHSISLNDPGHGHGSAGSHFHYPAGTSDYFAVTWGNTGTRGTAATTFTLISNYVGQTTTGGDHSHNNSGTGMSASANGAGTGISLYNATTGISVGNPTTTPAIGGAVGNPSTNPAITGTVDNPTTTPAITGTVGSPTTTPAIGGTVGDPTTNPAITGAVGLAGGMADTGAFVATNFLVKT
jgi:Phage Tail Collar Domain